MREFRAKHGEEIDAAAFGIAGPVRNGRSQTPNLPWVVDSASMAEVLGLTKADLINDLEANAHGIATLGPDDLAMLHRLARSLQESCVDLGGTGRA